MLLLNKLINRLRLSLKQQVEYSFFVHIYEIEIKFELPNFNTCNRNDGLDQLILSKLGSQAVYSPLEFVFIKSQIAEQTS